MNADQLTDAFEAREIHGADFPHESHLQVARTLTRRYGREEALNRLRSGLQDIARRAGRPEVYHETITRAWFELVAPLDDLDCHPELLDRRLLDRFYSRETLASGRDQWVEPDLHALRL